MAAKTEEGYQGKEIEVKIINLRTLTFVKRMAVYGDK
jgi:hypothetical protein